METGPSKYSKALFPFLPSLANSRKHRFHIKCLTQLIDIFHKPGVGIC